MSTTKTNEDEALIRSLKKEVLDLKTYVNMAIRQTALLQDSLERLVKDMNVGINGVANNVTIVQRTCEQDRKQFVVIQMQLEEDRRKQKEALNHILERIKKVESTVVANVSEAAE